LGAVLAGHGAVLDGEVVALDAQGRLDFEALRRRMRARAGVRAGRRPVAYLFFDLLWLDGRLLCPAPYAERRRLLDGLGLAGPAWQPVASFPDEGTALLAATRAQGLEGVVAKRLDSPYLPRRPPPAGRAPGGHAGRGQPVPRGPGGRWRRAGGEEPPPVFVRPELTVEVTFLGWEAGRLRHATLG
jgi:bifunctional non-homologous end joining protein LigD